MNRAKLEALIAQKRSVLCVGLDPDLDKLPRHVQEESEEPLFAFNKAIIDATARYAVAYKPNLAFYEAYGEAGWRALRQTVQYLQSYYPDHFRIADAKRGDIGNTSTRYAQAFFEELGFHALTVAPYMGADSVQPFLRFRDKWVILLALTSNEGASDFQFSLVADQVEARHQPLYEKVLARSKEWGRSDQLMYVVGATRAEAFQRIRALVPDHFLLIPGVGAQGGDLDQVLIHARGVQSPAMLVNASRSILYASSGVDFAEAAAQEAAKMQAAMAKTLFIEKK